MEKHFTNYFVSKKSGFTLVETLVALSIFSLSVLAMMSVLARGISDIDYAQNKIIATYLAQEGIETMRNMRDTYMLYATPPSSGWSAFTSRLSGTANCDNSNGCYFNDQNLVFNDPAQPITNPSYVSLTACGANCPLLLYSASTGKYNYAPGGTNTIFRRKINSTAVGGDQIRITSTVFFTLKSTTYQVVVSENLFNWAE